MVVSRSPACLNACIAHALCDKMDWGMSGDTSLLDGKPGFALDFNFFVEDNTVVIDEADVREQQGWVLSCVRLLKNRPISASPTDALHTGVHHKISLGITVT